MKWPADVTGRVGADVANALPLSQYLFVFAIFLLMADVIASARVAGRLALLVSCIWLATPDLVRAQGELSAASEIAFAHVLTGISVWIKWRDLVYLVCQRLIPSNIG